MISYLKRQTGKLIVALLLLIWCGLWLAEPAPIELVKEFGIFSGLGVIGAIFANATGAGGGVVFVPFFNYLSFSPQSVVATSFAIQCCGMTSGALTWAAYYKRQHKYDGYWQALPSALMLTIPSSICGIGFAQYSSQSKLLLEHLWGGANNLHIAFGSFSILLAIAIFASIPLMKRTHFIKELQTKDLVFLPFIGFLGGIITAWLSVGVGELVAVYLIIRGFNVTMSIAVAVILSAFTVWSALPYHAFINPSVVWQVVLFAGAGAVIGGMIAKYVVLAFSVHRLKLFFGMWVLILGITSLPIL
ncbi:sulfite exporter TauE/SafE family protein [Alteromonas macleodii]|uniref:Probable membrane transporter protein n=1 Tax=Alteromonas macleodii TaxID=28108 RepID=A0A6T9Y4A8_ALTMA|nr:sulfite exporter TauE/SafE family protein [Alteromonas macleodii]CAB9494598.1 putative membrane transporter protein [Alteromonas macleodii]